MKIHPLGTEFFNAHRYEKAIISFPRCCERAYKLSQFNDAL